LRRVQGDWGRRWRAEFVGRRGKEFDPPGLASAEFGDGAVPFAAGGLAAAEDLLKGLGALAILEEGGAERVFDAAVLLRDEGIEGFGFETGHASLGPIGGDNLLQEEGLFGTDGLELLVVRGGEFGEFGLVFAGDDEGFSGSGVLQGIESGRGFALGGAWAGRFLRIQAIGVDLSWCGHGRTVALDVGAGRSAGGKLFKAKEK